MVADDSENDHFHPASARTPLAAHRADPACPCPFPPRVRAPLLDSSWKAAFPALPTQAERAGKQFLVSSSHDDSSQVRDLSTGSWVPPTSQPTTHSHAQKSITRL